MFVQGLQKTINALWLSCAFGTIVLSSVMGLSSPEICVDPLMCFSAMALMAFTYLCAVLASETMCFGTSLTRG